MTRPKTRALGLTRSARPVADADLPTALVPHPRYGAAPRRSGLPEVLGALKNRALRQCGESVRIDRLARAIAELRPSGEVAS